MAFGIWEIAALVISYLLGSIPTGGWIGLTVKGIDIREHGSRNIGATNTMRILGKQWGAVALAGDMAKGVVAVLLVSEMGDWPHLPLACGIAAILGHTFSIFVRFRGGKGVATSAGVFLALAPIPTLIAAIIFGVVVWSTRMVSAGSIAAAVSLAVLIHFFDATLPVRIITTLVAVLIIFRHRTNLQRIVRGVENKI